MHACVFGLGEIVRGDSEDGALGVVLWGVLWGVLRVVVVWRELGQVLGGGGGRGADVGGWVGWGGGGRYHRLWERVVLELQDKLVLTARCDRAWVQRECWSGIYGIVWGKG